MWLSNLDVEFEYISPVVSVVEIQLEQVVLNASSGYLENEEWD